MNPNAEPVETMDAAGANAPPSGSTTGGFHCQPPESTENSEIPPKRLVETAPSINASHLGQEATAEDGSWTREAQAPEPETQAPRPEAEEEREEPNLATMEAASEPLTWEGETTEATSMTPSKEETSRRFARTLNPKDLLNFDEVEERV